jgi:hypothetical protein
MKLSELGRYYLISFVTAAIFWLAFLAIDIQLVNVVFFILAFIWHFTLLAPGIREKVLTQNKRFSFLSVIIRANYYLQLFLPAHKISHGAALVRAISPMFFSFLLFSVGGTGNLFFTLLGSFIFELLYLVMNKKPKEHKDDQETPPAIPSEGSASE